MHWCRPNTEGKLGQATTQSFDRPVANGTHPSKIGSMSSENDAWLIFFDHATPREQLVCNSSASSMRHRRPNPLTSALLLFKVFGVYPPPLRPRGRSERVDLGLHTWRLVLSESVKAAPLHAFLVLVDKGRAAAAAQFARERRGPVAGEE